MNTLIDKIKKIITKELIFYGIFGVLTTIINISVFYLLSKFTNIDKNISNIIAIFTAVIFAYFTNRKFVFYSNASNFKENTFEFIKFILGRLFTILIESGGFFILYNIIIIPELHSKIIVTIIVIILNYFISKFFTFKNFSL